MKKFDTAEDLLDMAEDIHPPREERDRDLSLASLLLFLHMALLLLPTLLSPLRAFSVWMHAAAYLLPLLLFALYARRTGLSPLLLPPRKKDLLAALPLLPLFLLAVISAAALTTLLFPTGGGSPIPDLGMALLSRALLPAALEEGLIRLALLSLLYRHLGSTAVYISAFFFMLLHAPISMPYALVGGILLGVVVLISRSAMVAFLFHFINNALSLGLSYLIGTNPGLSPRMTELVLLGSLTLLSALAIIYLVRHRRDDAYLPLASLLSSKGHAEGLMLAARSPLSLAAVFLLLLAVL